MRNIKNIFNLNYDLEIKDIKTNTKEINEGDAFVCIKGVNVDRHDYVLEAKDKGAKLLFVNHKLDIDLPQIIVNDTNKELVNIVTKFYDYPSTKMKMIGVTGTDGKTTTSTIIYQLLNQIIDTGYIGTNGVLSNNYKDDTNNTTPTPEHLHRILSNLYSNDCKCVCMECASEGLSQGRCETIMYDYTIYTNLTHEHLNFHKTMENYLDAKGTLFKQTKKEGYSILNIDDPFCNKIKDYCNGNIIYYGKNGDISFKNVIITPNNTKFDLVYKDKIYNITSPLIGMFNVYNLTAALSVLLLMNIDINKLDYNKLYIDGRMNNIDLNQDFKVIVDYAHTPNGYINLFELTKELPTKRTIVVAGSAGERDKTKRPIMGKILTDNADLVIFTYEDPRSENISDIIDDLVSKSTNNYVRISDRKEAIKYAINYAQKDDLVLILGKGNETYESMNYGKIYFNDIEEAKEALKERLNNKV